MTEEKKTSIERANFELSAIAAKDAFMEVTNNKTWIEEIGFALQILRGSAESFKKCDQVSIRNCVANVALTGSTLNPVLKRAYLIPRKVRGVLKCCLEFDYRGLIHIAVNSGSVLAMDATVVYKNDHFYYEKGLHPVLKHVPIVDGDPGEQIGVYAVADLHHGLKQFVYLPWSEVIKVQKASNTEKSLMWNDWIDEAAKKTAIKKLYKYLPQTDQMSVAVASANEAEGFDFEKRDPGAGKKILDRFDKEEPKGIEAGAEEPEPSTQEEAGDEDSDAPSSVTLEFAEKIKAAKDVEKLLTLFAEYELTKPSEKDLEIMAKIRDDRVMELKKK